MKKVFRLILANLLLYIAASQVVFAEEASYILRAAGKGNLETVNAMLKSGVSPNSADQEGITALMYAARKDEAQVIQALIQAGADVNLKDATGWTALMFAIKKNNIQSANVLLENGATANYEDSAGWSALNLAAVDGHAPIVELLLKHGVDAKATTQTGKTALMFAAKNGDVATIQLLLDHQADITAQDKYGANAFMYAARKGNAPALQTLSKYIDQLDSASASREAIINLVDKEEWTALTWAVKKSQVEAAKVLIEAGADVDHRDGQDQPILHYAVNNGNEAMVQLLLDHHVNVKAKDKYGLTALVYALKGQHTAIAKMIKAAGGNY